MKVLLIISTENGETIFNAMRFANVGVKNGNLLMAIVKSLFYFVLAGLCEIGGGYLV